MKRYISLLTIAATTACALAQDLHTEITVDRTVQPDIREVTRPTGATPTIVQPEIKLKHLTQAEYTNPSTLTPDISILPAAAWADSIARAKYRGYASVGYLPMYNAELNVGYRFLDTQRYGLGLWAQYNGESYHGDIPYYDDAKFQTHTATIGGNAYLQIGENSMLTAKGSASLKRVRVPYFYNLHGNEYRKAYNQGMKDISGEAQWLSHINSVVYHIDGEMGYFGMDYDIPASIREYSESVREALVKMGGGIGLADDNVSKPWVGIDADLAVLRTTNIPEVDEYWNQYFTYGNRWLGSIKPYLRFDNDVLEGLVGANLTIGHGFSGKIRIAPVAQITFRPTGAFAMYAKLTGGQHFNRMRDIVDINPYVLPSRSYAPTNIPFDLSGGINIGPYDGMSFGVSGGFASARDLLSPMITVMRNGYMISSYEAVNTKSWYIGANMAYAYKQWFVLSGSVKCGGADRDYNSWYQWADGAKVVADISLKVTPIDPLEVHLTYDMRYDRKARSIIYPYNTISQQIFVGIPNLGTVNSVNLGGLYKISDTISAFADVYNLLNTRCKLISGMPAPGIHGLIGVACKF